MNKIYIPEGYKPVLNEYETQRAIAYIKETFPQFFIIHQRSGFIIHSNWDLHCKFQFVGKGTIPGIGSWGSILNWLVRD